MDMTSRQDMVITKEAVEEFLNELRERERAGNTINKYRHDLDAFREFLDGRPVTKDLVLEYKRLLQSSGKAACSINSILSAINHFVTWAGRSDLRTAFLKIQRRVFRDTSQDLTREDYDRLVDAVYGGGNRRMGLLLETLGATGIRISELRYLTVETVSDGKADVDMKSKIRTIMVPGKLSGKLLDYAGDMGIVSGEIFLTKNGKSLSRQSVWRDMKVLAGRAGIPGSKVYPHNFRHMFATVFYDQCKDIVKLADVLGHSSINTTRIYLISSGQEHAEQLDRLDLVR